MNNIDTNGFVLKNTYDTIKSDLEKMITSAGDEIAKHGGVATRIVLNAVEKKL